MKIPHTINANYFKEYWPSDVALQLEPDVNRLVKSENLTWDEFHPPTLAELCVMVIVSDFQRVVILDKLPLWDKNLLLETLPLDLPLPLVVTHIDDGIYWKRKVKDRWKDEANYCQDYDFNWKRMYLEKHLEEAIEVMTPEGFDLENTMVLCSLTKDYVKKLNIRELRAPQIADVEDEVDLEADMDNDDYEGERGGIDAASAVASFFESSLGIPLEHSDHINLAHILRELTNLTELRIQFGVRNIGSDYKEHYFKFSLQDCRNLGEGISELKGLKFLKVQSCNLDDERLVALLSSMRRNESIESLDLSNCIFANQGASALAKFMKNRMRLKSLNISNNRIEENGISLIAYVLARSDASPLEYLNLKSNAFGDEGFKLLASALIRETATIQKLNVSCCCLTEESGIFLGEVLNRNSILIDLDLSNNSLKEGGSRPLEVGVENSKTIQYLDLRETETPEERLLNINSFLHFNRIRARKGEKGVVREMKLMEKRAEEERLRLERKAIEEAKAAEEAAAKAAREAAIAAAFGESEE